MSVVLPVTSIPGWPTPPAGLMENFTAQNGGPVSISPDGLHVADQTLAQAYLASFVGSATELAYNKTIKQAALDALFDANFDLAKFIRGGQSTGITATNVGNFLATITNNYRSLRAQIAAATSVAQVQAININAGWPSNP